ncbi:MAG: hypothetical protein ACTSX1_11470, partial [Candidatus Heimdallarchaeaceae archaeon]
DIANRVDAATIGTFSPGGEVLPDTDVAFIQNQLNPLGNQQLALPDATQELFTPGINIPLRAGGTSGQLTGSRDIFVAQNQAVPFALLERRRAKQQEAAQKRAKDLERFKLRKPALSKDPRFNRNLIETQSEFTDIFIKRAEEQFGSKQAGLAALSNPGTKIGREFAQQMDNLEVLAGEIDQVVDLNAEVEKSIQEGDQFVSDETLKLHKEFQTLSGEFLEGSAFGAASFRDKLTNLQTSQSVDQFFKDNATLANISGEVLQRAGVDDSRADQFRTSTRFTKDFEKGARAQAKAIKENAAFRGREDLSEEDIFKRIMALKGKVDKRSVTVKGKRKFEGFKTKEDVPINNQPKIINVGNTQFRTKTSVPYPEKVQKNPVRIDGLIVLNEDGNLVTQTGITNFIPVENDVIDVNGIDGRFVRGKIVTEKRNPVTGKIEKSFEDATVDFDNIKTSIEGLSSDAALTVQAFDDVSQASKRSKTLIDEKNFDSDFQKAFTQSGFSDPDDFIKAAQNQGIDVILNKESVAKKNALKDPLNQ